MEARCGAAPRNPGLCSLSAPRRRSDLTAGRGIVRRHRLAKASILLALSFSVCCHHDVTPKARTAITRTNVRFVSEALAEFRKKAGAYPETGASIVPLSGLLGNQLVEEGYLRTIPKDGWLNVLGFWSNGIDVIVASPGANGRYEIEYGREASSLDFAQAQSVCSKWSSSSNDDVVMVDGDACVGMGDEEERDR